MMAAADCTPSVSVVIPTVGRQSVIELARRSQSVLGVCEVLVVFQGSDNDTMAFLSDIPLVRLILFPERIGLVEARWQGLRRARGEIVLCLDDDIAVDVALLDLLVSRVGGRIVGVGGVVRNRTQIGGWRAALHLLMYRGMLYDARRHLPAVASRPDSEIATRFVSGGIFAGDRTSVVRAYEQVRRVFSRTAYSWGEDAFLGGFMSELGQIRLLPAVEVVNMSHGFITDLTGTEVAQRRVIRYAAYVETFVSRPWEGLLALLGVLPSALRGGWPAMLRWSRCVVFCATGIRSGSTGYVDL